MTKAAASLPAFTESATPEPVGPDDTNRNNAEIKSRCRLASLFDIPLIQTPQNVVSMAFTAGDKIKPAAVGF